jgi:hypothetical protein
MNRLQREQIRLDSIEKQLFLASEYKAMAESYLKKGKIRQAQQMTRSAERCQRYADFLSSPDK